MFWVMWLVTASSSQDPVADSSSHSAWRCQGGAGAGAADSAASGAAGAAWGPTPPGRTWRKNVHAETRHNCTNSAYTADQAVAWSASVARGSITKG